MAAAVGVLVVAALAPGCARGTAAPTTTTSTSSTTPSGPDAAGTVWLCRPGRADDPCAADGTATVVRSDGSTSVQRTPPAADPPVDCFYVYPTVSTEPGENADLTVQPAETSVARAQASRFASVCRVYAPMYPQLTLGAIRTTLHPTAVATAYLGVLSAWKDYLAHDNHGRGVVLIGHSQGASMLIALIHRQIDPDPSVRRLLVSALLLGGNVTVPVGGVVGGSFDHVPACTSAGQTGCVVAYSSFDTAPPADSLFGRVGAGLGDRSGVAAAAPSGTQVLCTNPAALAGGTAHLDPYFPTDRLRTTVTTPWVTYPGHYTGTCTTSGGATWLQVDTVRTPDDTRPVVAQALGPTWGLHLVDVNIALGDLVRLVGRQAAAYTG